MSEETCVRCGDGGEDRRTLWMACFYEMSELGLPFEIVELLTVSKENVTETVKEIEITTTKWPHGKPVVSKCPGVVRRANLGASVSASRFYSLRVCKDCRADWMAAIKLWFTEFPKVKTGCGSGIFVRENGRIVEITEEEWNKRNPGRDPVKVHP